MGTVIDVVKIAVQEQYKKLFLHLFAGAVRTHEVVLFGTLRTGLASSTCHVGAIDEIAIDGKMALIVPPQNTVALTAALQRLNDDIDLRSRLDTAARQFASGHCAFSAMCDAMEDVLRSMASRAA